jgi:NAD(P)-dependent dehydrogenase (short-subunit alcohol dehydrogenase family)
MSSFDGRRVIAVDMAAPRKEGHLRGAAPFVAPVEPCRETNVFGTVFVIDAFLPLLFRMSAAGRIVNVSSTMGSLSDQGDPTSPYFGLIVPTYQTSKAALNGITVALAKLLEGRFIGVAATSSSKTPTCR